jgi:hypothetical protein
MCQRPDKARGGAGWHVSLSLQETKPHCRALLQAADQTLATCHVLQKKRLECRERKQSQSYAWHWQVDVVSQS